MMGKWCACCLTFPVRHGVKEAPGGVDAGAAAGEGHVVRCLDAHHGEQLHVHPRYCAAVVGQHLQTNSSVSIFLLYTTAAYHVYEQKQHL